MVSFEWTQSCQTARSASVLKNVFRTNLKVIGNRRGKVKHFRGCNGSWIPLPGRHFSTSRLSARCTDRGLSRGEIAQPVLSFCNYLFKTQLKRNRKGALFATICHILPGKENRWFHLRRKKILSTENNVRPNGNDSDHVLTTTIDVRALTDHR
jgi:hypothetical protein